MIRVDEETGLGVTVATDANGRYCQLDPKQGARLALARRTGTSPSPVRSPPRSPTA